MGKIDAELQSLETPGSCFVSWAGASGPGAPPPHLQVLSTHPCPLLIGTCSLWLEALPQAEAEADSAWCLQEGRGAAGSRWARKQAGASCPALTIPSVSCDCLLSAPSADGSFVGGGPGHLFQNLSCD